MRSINMGLKYEVDLDERRTHQFCIKITPTLAKKLRRLAKETNRSFTYLMEYALLKLFKDDEDTE